MPEVVPRSHWMIEVTRRSGLLRPERSTMALGPTLTDVRQAVARACDVTESDLALQIARHYRMATADLATASSSAQSLIPEKLARRFAAFPVRADDRHITVAVSDPTNIEMEQAFGFASGRVPVFVIAPPEEIQRALDGRYAPDRLVERMVSSVGEEIADQVRLIEDDTPEVVRVIPAQRTSGRQNSPTSFSTWPCAPGPATSTWSRAERVGECDFASMASSVRPCRSRCRC